MNLLLSLLQPLRAEAMCQWPYPPRVCAEFFANDLVFTGKVISSRSFPPGSAYPDRDPGSQGGSIYRLKVYKSYRGKIGQTIEVFSDNDSDGITLDSGKSYLVFAHTGMEDAALPVIYGCALNNELPKARSTIREIKAVLHAKPGSGGHIGGGFTPTGDTTDLSGICIATAKGGGRTYEAETAKDGSWDMWVPAGSYDLQSKSPDWYISPDDGRSLYPFKNIDIHDGGCADVEFSGMHLMR